MKKPRYDGFQEDMFSSGLHCFTITDTSSPAFGHELQFETYPDDELMLRAVREKEQEIAKTQ